MPKLIKLDDLTVCTESEFRARFCNTSFGPTINFEEFGYAVVFDAPPPACDPITQTVREIAPVLTSKGHYEQAWEVVALDADTIAANQAAAAAAVVETHNASIGQQIAAVEAQFTNTLQMRAFSGDVQAKAEIEAMLSQICALKAQLV